MKTVYHPSILVAFYLHCLPDDLMVKIPRSTKYDWERRDIAISFGYDWYCHHQQLFSTLKEVVNNKKLMQLNRALLRIIALQHFLKKYAAQIQEKVFSGAATAVNNFKKAQHILGLAFNLKLLQFSYRQYGLLKQKTRCKKSLLLRCIPKHPVQLLRKEVGVIKKYGEDPDYIHWPLSSVYHKIIRDDAAHFHLSTFYKYAGLLKQKRYIPAHRRKNHSTGIRATAPLQLIHADSTVFQTADKVKAYIYLIQDNFSRTILKHRVATKCKAHIVFENLTDVCEQYLKPMHRENCELVTDDGSENHGPVNRLIADPNNPIVKHIIAQRDVEFSNSMIEAANKNLKYRFLYHKRIADFNELCIYVQQAVDDYNNRPHDVLHGLSPLEVLNGKTIDKDALHNQKLLAKAKRMTENKKESCCTFSF